VPTTEECLSKVGHAALAYIRAYKRGGEVAAQYALAQLWLAADRHKEAEDKEIERARLERLITVQLR